MRICVAYELFQLCSYFIDFLLYLYQKQINKKKPHSCNKKQLREDKFIVSYPMIVKMDFTKGGQLL